MPVTQHSSTIAPLLDHAEFLRRLAAQLAGAQADDLVQDTWVAALRAPAEQVHEPRGLLRTIATNLWHNTRRAQRRRLQREARQAQYEGTQTTPSVAEISAREEARHCVVAAVLDLPEPLREVVLLQFYEGLTSAQIGERLGLSPSGVRTRMQAAIARLRQQLDQQHGGRRDAWAGPLLAWTHFGATAEVPRIVSAWVVRGAALLAAVGVLVVSLQWQGHEPPPPPPLQNATAQVGEQEGTPDWVAVAGLPTQRRDAAAGGTVAAPRYRGTVPEGSLLGVVRDDRNGLPLAAVAITVRRVDSDTPAGIASAPNAPSERSLATDAGGEFRLPALPAGLYEIDAHERGGRRGHARVAVGQDQSRVALWLREQPQLGAVLVKVRDAAGRAVAGADVSVHVVCTRRGPIGFAGQAAITGRSDASGLFRWRQPELLEHVFEGLVVARCADGRVGLQTIGRPEHRGVNPYHEVVVDRPGRIEGRLSGTSGRDLTGVQVVAQALWTYSHVRPQAVEFAVVVAADGSFDVQVPAGRYHLDVRGLPGLQRELSAPVDNWQFLPQVVVRAGEVSNAPLPMVVAATLRGQVQNERGQPLAGAAVTARWLAGEEQELPPWFHHLCASGDPNDHIAEPYTVASAVCDAAGRYELALRAGRWSVEVAAAGYTMSVQRSVQLAQTPVELQHTLTADGALCGRTSFERIGLQAVDGDGLVHSFRTTSGWFTVRGLQPGTWRVGGFAGARFVVLATVPVRAAEIGFVDCDALACTVRGVVMCNGQPLAQLGIEIGGERPLALTSADGSFEVQRAPGEASSLCITHRGVLLHRVELGERIGQELDLGQIVLHVRQLHVRAQDASGAPRPATIEVVDYHDYRDRPLRQFCDGGVLAGQWIPAAPGNLWAHAVFEDGCRATLRIDAQTENAVLQHRPVGTLVVRVVDRDGAACGGSSLAIEAWGRDDAAPRDGATFHAGRVDDGWPRMGVTDPDGVLTLRGVPAGPVLVYYRGTWSRYGYDAGFRGAAEPPPAEAVIDLMAGRTINVDLVLPRQ